LTEASAAALVMKHVNRYNGLNGSFDYITSIEQIEGTFRSDEIDNPTWVGDVSELISEVNAI